MTEHDSLEARVDDNYKIHNHVSFNKQIFKHNLYSNRPQIVLSQTYD